MAVSSISEGVQSELLSFYSNKSQSSVSDNQRILSTGLKDSLERGVSADRIMNISAKLSSIGSYKNTIATAQSRVGLIVDNLENLFQMSNQLKVDLTRVRSSNAGTDPGFSKSCKERLMNIQNILNSRDNENRYLYGGTATDRPAVDISLVTSPGNTDAPKKDYFIGNSIETSLKVGDNETQVFDYFGDKDCYAELIHAFKLAEDANIGVNPDLDRLGAAMDWVEKAQVKLAAEMKVTMDRSNALGTLLDRHSSQELQNTDSYGEEVGADIVQTTIALQNSVIRAEICRQMARILIETTKKLVDQFGR